MSSDMLAAILSQQMLPVLFVYAEFLDGPVRVWSGYGPIVWHDQTWNGIGTLLQVSSIEEGFDVNARGIALTLSGFDANLLAEALGQVQQGLPVVVYTGAFYNGSPGVVISDPLISWAGQMDQPVIDVMNTTATISLSCENILVEMNKAVDRRYTNEDQQRDWPGDAGMSFVSGIQDKTIYWGRMPKVSQ